MRQLWLEVYKVWYGVRFFERTNSPESFVLASYHHPDSITWRWSVWYSKPRRAEWCWPKIGPGYKMGTNYWASNGYFSGWIRLPYVGGVSLNTQPAMWRS